MILGDSGAGKSTFNLELERNLWKAYNTNMEWIPIFVTLPAVDKPEEDLIVKQLRRCDFTDDKIRELKSYRQFVLICDGYDECQKMDNLYNDNRLNQPGEWKVKMVISCRSEYLGSDYRVLFQPGGRNDRKGATQLQEAVVAPFTVTKINDYVRSYVANYQSASDAVWRVEEYESAIKNIPNLQELVRNPFMLSLALEVLPRLVDLSKDFRSSKISRVTLYDEFVEQWIERGQKRLTELSLTGEDYTAFKDLLEDGFTQHTIGFLKDLAMAIFDKQDGKPVVEYSPFRDKASWKVAFFGRGDGKNLLREACPLSRSGNHYRFIHRSVLEYGLARAVFDPRPSGEDYECSVDQLDVHDVIALGDLSLEAKYGSPLFRKSFVHEHSIINFLSERAQQNPEFKDQLHGFIDRSKTNELFSQAAANAITILVRAGVRFNGADLRGIRVPGANLSGGEFDSAQLQGSDLSNTILRNVWLRRADLSNSRMEGVTFGQYPHLEVEDGALSCAFSPDGSQLAVGVENGSIEVYDTSTWNKVIFQRQSCSVKSDEHSASGLLIASESLDSTIKRQDAHTIDVGPTLSGHTDAVTSVVYSPTRKQIASCSWDETVRLWDAETGELRLTLSCHTNYIYSVAYSPCGLQIASSSGDKTVRLWDTETGDLRWILSSQTALFSPQCTLPPAARLPQPVTMRLFDCGMHRLASLLRL